MLVLLEDIAELKPTVFTSVPRLYNRIHDKARGTCWSMRLRALCDTEPRTPHPDSYCVVIAQARAAQASQRVWLSLSGREG